MTILDYRRPRSLAEASELLRSEDAVALAGGTDLMVGVRRRRTGPGTVVDLKTVEEIGDDIESGDGLLRIGGRVVMSQLTAHSAVNRHFPALAKAAAVVGSVQIRNRATIAGNLCNASPAADTAPSLLAYSAVVTVAGPSGGRSIPLEEFFVGPGATVLTRGEVLTGVELPIPVGRVGSAFARVTRRRGVDLASVSIACTVDDGGGARFGFGAVGPTPLVATSTTAELTGDGGLSGLLSVTSPISDLRASADYRHAMLEVHTRRCLQEAAGALEAGG